MMRRCDLKPTTITLVSAINTEVSRTVAFSTLPIFKVKGVHSSVVSTRYRLPPGAPAGSILSIRYEGNVRGFVRNEQQMFLRNSVSLDLALNEHKTVNLKLTNTMIHICGAKDMEHGHLACSLMIDHLKRIQGELAYLSAPENSEARLRTVAWLQEQACGPSIQTKTTHVIKYVFLSLPDNLPEHTWVKVMCYHTAHAVPWSYETNVKDISQLVGEKTQKTLTSHLRVHANVLSVLIEDVVPVERANTQFAVQLVDFLSGKLTTVTLSLLHLKHLVPVELAKCYHEKVMHRNLEFVEIVETALAETTLVVTVTMDATVDNTLLLPDIEQAPDDVDRRMAAFLTVSMNDHEYFLPWQKELAWLKDLKCVYTREPVMGKLQKAMMNYNFSLGFRVNRAVLATEIMRINNSITAIFDGFALHYVLIEMQFKANDPDIRRKKNSGAVKFMVYQSGKVTQSGPNEHLNRVAYKRLMPILHQIKHKIQEKNVAPPSRRKYRKAIKSTTQPEEQIAL